MKRTKAFYNVLILLAALLLTACQDQKDIPEVSSPEKNLVLSDHISNQKVKSICEDRYGQIWIGTFRGLNKYDGTLIVVSHDRDFLEGLVDKMYEFRDGKVKEHLGSVHEFLEERKIENLQELERRFSPKVSAVPDAKNEVDSVRKEQAQKEFEQRRSDSKEIRRIRHRVEFLESEIGKVEARMKDIEKILSNPGPGDDIMELTRTYLEDKRELDHKTAEWESLMEKIDE